MVSNISSCTKALVLLISLLGVSSFSLRAQEKDFATWANAGFEYKLKPAFTVSGGLEWRTKDDLGKTDRWGLKVGGSYKLLPFLKLGAGYETHYRNRGADGWKFRHRYRLEGTLSARVQRVCVSAFSIRSMGIGMSSACVRVRSLPMTFRSASWSRMLRSRCIMV